MKTIKCPTCGKKITRDDLRYAQQGTMYYKISFDKHGIEYENDEFDAKDGGEFFHDECGGKTLDEEQLKTLGVEQ